MRVIFIGCVEFSVELFKVLLLCPEAEIVGIISKTVSPLNSDFNSSLKTLAVENGIPFYDYSEKGNVGMEEWAKNLSPDIVFCFGWSHLLQREIIECSKLGVVGYHPTALPKNRGRHPIIWTLALGLTETASTFFFIEEEADTGDLLSQIFVPVTEEDTAHTLYKKLLDTAKEQLVALTKSLNSGNYERRPQSKSESNTWRKRSKEDGVIDFRMPSTSIYNLVRALAHPYPGALVQSKGSFYKVNKCRVTKYGSTNDEPGKILSVGAHKSLIVKSGNGAIELLEHEINLDLKVGDYL